MKKTSTQNRWQKSLTIVPRYTLSRCVSVTLLLLCLVASKSSGEIPMEKIGDPVFEVSFNAMGSRPALPHGPTRGEAFSRTIDSALGTSSFLPVQGPGVNGRIPRHSLDVPLSQHIREQFAANGIVNTDTYVFDEINWGNMIMVNFHLKPADNAPLGASPTSAMDQVIPNDIFPLEFGGGGFRNGASIGDFDFQVPSLDSIGGITEANGVEHDFTGLNFDAFVVNTWQFAGRDHSGPSLVGEYEQTLEVRDKNGNGWRFTIPYTAVLEATDIEGDLSYSGALDLHDYNILQQNVEVAPAEPHGEFLRRLDLNGDNLVNDADTRHLVSLFPETEVSSLTVGETYSQDFDSLGTDGTAGSALPNGWSVPDRFGGPLVKETNAAFPTSSRDIGAVTAPHALNVGLPEGEGVQDRSLAIYKPRNTTDTSSIQLLADSDTQANALKVDFSVEAWDRIRATSGNRDGGEAAFNVTVEIDSGDGTSDMSKILGGEFTELVNLGMVTTGAELPSPDGDYLDGNDPAHRVSFASDILHADIPAGSRLRFRWETSGEADASEEWIFGIDDVSITLAAAGDTNFDGEVQFDDFLALSANFGEEGGWAEGDFDGNGQVDFPDFLVLSANFGGADPASAASVPEPTAASIALFGLLGLIGYRKRR